MQLYLSNMNYQYTQTNLILYNKSNAKYYAIETTCWRLKMVAIFEYGVQNTLDCAFKMSVMKLRNKQLGVIIAELDNHSHRSFYAGILRKADENTWNVFTFQSLILFKQTHD